MGLFKIGVYWDSCSSLLASSLSFSALARSFCIPLGQFEVGTAITIGPVTIPMRLGKLCRCFGFKKLKSESHCNWVRFWVHDITTVPNWNWLCIRSLICLLCDTNQPFCLLTWIQFICQKKNRIEVWAMGESVYCLSCSRKEWREIEIYGEGKNWRARRRFIGWLVVTLRLLLVIIQPESNLLVGVGFF